MPVTRPQAGLQRVIGGTRRRLELIDVEETGENGSRCIGTRVEAGNRTIGKREPGILRPRVKRGDLGLARLIEVAEAE